MGNLLRPTKPAVFVGSSRRELKAFPDQVRQDIGQALFEVQLGLHPKAAKPLKGFGSGVLEIATATMATPIEPSTRFASTTQSTCFTCSRRNRQAELRPPSAISI